MQRKVDMSAAVGCLLSEQAGVISREQAIAAGLSPTVIQRLVKEGRWIRVGWGSYALSGVPDSFLRRCWVGHLRAGPESAIGGLASLAARSLRLPPDQIEVVVPRAARRAPEVGFWLRRDGVGRLEHRRGLLPLVRVEDALLDCREELSLEQWVGAVTDAVRERLTMASAVETVLRHRTRYRRRDETLAVLADLQGLESNLEFRYRRDVERGHSLPQGRRQVRTRVGRGDVLYEEYGVLVEVDGKRGHLDGRFRDFRRDNEHATDLMVTLRYGSHDIRSDPCGVAHQVGRALAVRGWRGGPPRWPACRDWPAR